MKNVVVSALFLTSIMVFSATVQADITRGCTASLDVFVMDNKPNPATGLASIEGRGSCDNKLHANECRARARKQIDQCRADLWAGRHKNEIPASCRNIVEGSGRSGANLEYDGILIIAQPQRLTARGASAVCFKLRPNADKLVVSFSGRINGDEKCASTKIGKNRFQDEFGYPKYDMNCGEWRKQGICD